MKMIQVSAETAMETKRAERCARPVWLYGAGFDSAFILGGIALALVSGIAIVIEPSLFYPILLLDLWVLGYHHVIATFTQLCFDRARFEERRGLIVHLLPAVTVATLLVAWQVGLWVIVTIYFYWQWWHYARQSWGVSRAYRRADPEALYEAGWLDHAIFYSIPVWGILLRSSQDHAHFLGLELWTLPVPVPVADIAGYVVAALMMVWAARRLVAMVRGRLATVHTLYMLTHIAIFTIAYVWLDDITFGYLMITIWHNCQYILFVWMQNRRRFQKGIDPQARFLSWISQPSRLWLYLLTCIAIAAVVYGGLLRAIDWLFFASVSATLVLYQIVNFHHYIVDALIWKTRKPAATHVPAHAA